MFSEGRLRSRGLGLHQRARVKHGEVCKYIALPTNLSEARNKQNKQKRSNTAMRPVYVYIRHKCLKNYSPKGNETILCDLTWDEGETDTFFLGMSLAKVFRGQFVLFTETLWSVLGTKAILTDLCLFSLVYKVRNGFGMGRFWKNWG